MASCRPVKLWSNPGRRGEIRRSGMSCFIIGSDLVRLRIIGRFERNEESGVETVSQPGSQLESIV